MTQGNQRRADAAPQQPRPVAQANIDPEILAMLYRALPRALAVSFINALLTVYVMRDQTSSLLLAVWIAAIIGITAVRAAMIADYQRKPDRVPARRRIEQFTMAAIASGTVWGSSAAVLMSTASMGHLVYIGFILAGMAAGAMSSLPYHWPAYRGYVLASVAPYAIVMMAQGGELPVVMGALALIFITAMIQGGLAFNASFIEMLKLRLSREAMANDLAAQSATLLETNVRLGAEIARANESEKQLRAAKEEADAASEAKTRFLANMSHEIRTPMNGVLGMTDIILKTSLDERQRRLAQTIKSSGTMLLGIIEDVLDISRIEAGKLSLVRERFGLRECLMEAADLLGEGARNKGIELLVDLSPDLPEHVEGDPVRLRQVCVNLIGNAIKFTNKGSVTLIARPTLIRGRHEGVWIEVRDTGIGIAPEALARITQPFEQADTSISRRFGGTGLGLSISTNLVEMMGGKLEIASEQGHGTTASFAMPLAVASAPEGEKSGNSHQDTNFDIDVLIADDSPVNIEIARTYLEELGCRVVTAHTGEAAVQAYRDQRFDLVMMDCEMPLLDGYQATAEIRSIELKSQRPRTPVVALTASVFESDRRACEEAGMDGHLSKPYTQEQLAAGLALWSAKPTPRENTADAFPEIGRSRDPARSDAAASKQ